MHERSCRNCLNLTPFLGVLTLGGSTGLLQRLPPDRRWRIPDAEFSLHLIQILVPPPLPVNGYQASCAPTASERPRDILFQPIAPCSRQLEWCSNSRQTRHWKPEIRKLKGLHDNLVFDTHWHRRDTVIQVVTLTVPLHHVGKFWIIDVVNLKLPVNNPETAKTGHGERTGARLSGVTPHRSSQVMYARPNVPSGRLESASMSTVLVFIRGRSLRMALPSPLASILSRKPGRTGPAVNSPNAATISGLQHELNRSKMLNLSYPPPRLGSNNAVRPVPTVRNACSNVLNGT